MAQWPKYSATRFDILGLSQCGRSLWRYVALDEPSKLDCPNVVGPHYRTKAEALADLERYARDGWGL